MLEVSLHGEQLRHGVADGRARGEYHAPVAGQLGDVAALHVHIAGLLRLDGVDAGDIAHLCYTGEVFVAVRLVHIEHIHAQFLEGDNGVLVFVAVQLLQPRFQRLLRAFHLLDGKAFAAGVFQLLDAIHDLLDLCLQHFPLAFPGDGDALKLAVAHDDGVVVAGGDAAHESLAVLLLKVLSGRHQHLCRGKEAQELGGSLLRQVVRHGDQRLVAQADAYLLHDAGHHDGGLARANGVRQQRVAAIEDARHGVLLMGPQLQFRVHAGEAQV